MNVVREKDEVGTRSYIHTKKPFSSPGQAFNDAMSELDAVESEHYKECLALMQSLKDNLSKWKDEKN